MMYRALLFSAAIITVTAQQTGTAIAWGASGHRMISNVALHNLAADVPAFLTAPNAVAVMVEIAREPDRSRQSGKAHDLDLDPGHFVDVGDDATINGAVPLSALPETRENYDSALRRSGTDQYRMGYLPYAIEEGWQQLVKDLAYWRIDVAAQKFAKSAVDRAWLARDQKLREALTIRDLGYWAHFVEDASQPMHVSLHYDGWGPFPNPNNYPTQNGLHFHFEGSFVHANVTEADIRNRLSPVAMEANTIHTRVGAYLAATNAKVIPLYEMAKVHPFDGDDPAEKDFVVERLAAGTSMLRDLIDAAWTSSEDAKAGLPGVAVRDVEARGLADLAPLRGDD